MDVQTSDASSKQTQEAVVEEFGPDWALYNMQFDAEYGRPLGPVFPGYTRRVCYVELPSLLDGVVKVWRCQQYEAIVARLTTGRWLFACLMRFVVSGEDEDADTVVLGIVSASYNKLQQHIRRSSGTVPDEVIVAMTDPVRDTSSSYRSS